MTDIWNVAIQFMPAVPTLTAGVVGYFFGKKSKQDRVINDLVIIEKLEIFQTQHAFANVDSDIEDSRARLRRSLKSLRKTPPGEKRSVIFIIALWALCTGMFIISVLPHSAEDSFDHHPFWAWTGSLLTVGSIGAGLGLIVSLAWDGLKALCEWIGNRKRSKQRGLISGESEQ